MQHQLFGTAEKCRRGKEYNFTKYYAFSFLFYLKFLYICLMINLNIFDTWNFLHIILKMLIYADSLEYLVTSSFRPVARSCFPNPARMQVYKFPFYFQQQSSLPTYMHNPSSIFLLVKKFLWRLKYIFHKNKSMMK